MNWPDVESVSSDLITACSGEAQAVAGQLPHVVTSVWFNPVRKLGHVGLVDSAEAESASQQVAENLARKLGAAVEYGFDYRAPGNPVEDVDTPWVRLNWRGPSKLAAIRRDADTVEKSWLRGLAGSLPSGCYATPEKTAAALAGGALCSANNHHSCVCQSWGCLRKEADYRTGLGLQSWTAPIPVDQTKDLVWYDPEVGGRLPVPIRAATSGLVEAAYADRTRRYGRSPGMRLVYPTDIARIAAGAGSGYLSGALVGKALGAVFGLSSDTQKKLRQTGALAGIIGNVVPHAVGVTY